jgi:hypothetical protein
VADFSQPAGTVLGQTIGNTLEVVMQPSFSTGSLRDGRSSGAFATSPP